MTSIAESAGILIAVGARPKFLRVFRFTVNVLSARAGRRPRDDVSQVPDQRWPQYKGRISSIRIQCLRLFRIDTIQLLDIDELYAIDIELLRSFLALGHG